MYNDNNSHYQPVVFTRPKKGFPWSTFFLIILALGIAIAWFFWGWKIVPFVVLPAVCLFSIPIWRWVWRESWKTDEEIWCPNRLQKIWDRAGIIEIQGGAETGKSLLIILLIKNFGGKVWTNIPNRISGCQKLTLKTLQQIYHGNYPQGMTGQNNLIFIDDTWDFFNKKDLAKYDLTHQLGSLFMFLSETSKTGIKFFFVSKQGMKVPNAFSLLSANRSGFIRTLGKRHYISYGDMHYYYLDYQYFPEQRIEPVSKKRRQKKTAALDDDKDDDEAKKQITLRVFLFPKKICRFMTALEMPIELLNKIGWKALLAKPMPMV